MYYYIIIILKLCIYILYSVKKTWTTIKAKGAIITGRTGHSATYDQVTNKVFIFGGFTAKYTIDSDLFIFDVAEETW